MTTRKVPLKIPKIATKPTLVFLKAGILGVLGILSFYFLLLFAITKDLSHPINQFKQLNPWISILVIGFGIQVGLFWFIRKGFHFCGHKGEGRALKVGTGVTGVSMAACCAHHIADVIPLLGISGIAPFFTKYQTEMIFVGIFINGLGILYMLWIILDEKHSRFSLDRIFNFASEL